MTGFSQDNVFATTIMITSGNMYKASAQFIIDHTVKENWKKLITLVKEEIERNKEI